MRFNPRTALAAALASIVLAACGGGDAPTAEPAPLRAAAQVPMAGVTPAAGAFMDWAQAFFPSLFPGVAENRTLAPFTFRYYPATQNFLAVANGTVYVMGPATRNAPLPIAGVADFACRVYPGSCPVAPSNSDIGGSYVAFATTGERFTLNVDSQQRTFTFSGLTVPSFASAASFLPSTGARSFQFAGGARNTGFRSIDDLLVGSYDFGSGATPFVAARRWVTSFAEAAGTYNNLGVTRTTAGAPDSTIYSSRIDADGTLRICNSSTVFTFNHCTASAVQVYSLALQSDGTFRATPTSFTGDPFNFRIAKAGNENVYLMGAVGINNPSRFFRIGVQEAPTFDAGTAIGGTNSGEWGTATFGTSSYASSGVAADGRTISLTGTLGTMGTQGPTGMRGFQSGGNGFAIQNTQLAVLVGARNGVSAGYIQIGAR